MRPGGLAVASPVSKGLNLLNGEVLPGKCTVDVEAGDRLTIQYSLVAVAGAGTRARSEAHSCWVALLARGGGCELGAEALAAKCVLAPVRFRLRRGRLPLFVGALEEKFRIDTGL